MVNKGLGIAIILGSFWVFPLPASMVSFLVIETGLRPEANGGAYSDLWEDGLMGVFFDEGHIVSNGPVMRVEKIPEAEFPEIAQEDFLEASRGGADYFILVLLVYRPQGGLVRPQEAIIKIFNTGVPRNLIFEGSFPAGTGPSLRDDYIKAQETARILAAQLNKDR